MLDVKAVIFDLDGTLIDSIRDIAAAGNQALHSLGQPTHPVDAYRQFIGEGADVLMQRALPDDQQHLTPQGLAEFKAYYAQHLSDFSTIYEGIDDVLDALIADNIAIAVLTNKPEPAAIAILNKMMPDRPWFKIAGQRDDIPKKPDPTAALAIANELNTPPQSCAFVGDSRPDMLTATRASMIPIGALWGYRDRTELQQAGSHVELDHPHQILHHLKIRQTR